VEQRDTVGAGERLIGIVRRQDDRDAGPSPPLTSV
jgi:hypothetical protein